MGPELVARCVVAPARTRRVGLLVVAALSVSSALVGLSSGSALAAPKPAVRPHPVVHAKTPPANPTDKQIKQAASRKSQAASDVGRLSGLIAGIDGQITNLDGLSELAGEKYLKAKWDLGLAETAATKAQNAVTAAQANYTKARARFRLYVAAAYMNRSGDSSGLLTASDPNALLERDALGRYTTGHQLDAIGTLTRATVGRANAVSAAKRAVALKTTRTTAANAARIAAGLAVSRAKAKRVTLVAQKGSYETQLTAAGEALTGLTNKRAAYNAWVVMEKKIQAAAARRARIAHLRMLAAQARERARLARLAQIAAQKQRAADARRRAAERSHHSSNSNGNSGNNNSSSNSGSNNSGSSNNGGGNSGNGGGNFGASDGNWTPSKGRAAVARAERWLGTNYSFDAGNYHGPSYGTCVSGVEWNACHVWGFDCSGLAMYAWSPAGIYMPHYAASQYGYGSVHPSVDQLQPGDLTFWSSDGTVAGIHHVAIYIGNGNVIEAPHTGSVVKIVPLWFDGYFGAVRPGS